jgi:hypothetical protein
MIPFWGLSNISQFRLANNMSKNSFSQLALKLQIGMCEQVCCWYGATSPQNTRNIKLLFLMRTISLVIK